MTDVTAKHNFGSATDFFVCAGYSAVSMALTPLTLTLTANLPALAQAAGFIKGERHQNPLLDEAAASPLSTSTVGAAGVAVDAGYIAGLNPEKLGKTLGVNVNSQSTACAAGHVLGTAGTTIALLGGIAAAPAAAAATLSATMVGWGLSGASSASGVAASYEALPEPAKPYLGRPPMASFRPSQP